MKWIYPAILAGAALVGLAAFAPSLAGKDSAEHQLTVALPGGGTQTIRYTGDAVPQVTVSAYPFEIADPAPAFLGFEPSFVALDRLSLDMDRALDGFLRQADMLARLPANPEMDKAVLQTFPGGGTSYSLISESVGNGVCTRTVAVIQRTNRQKPQVVSQESGNCDAGGAKALAPDPASGALQAIDAQTSVSAPDAPRTAL